MTAEELDALEAHNSDREHPDWNANPISIDTLRALIALARKGLRYEDEQDPLPPQDVTYPPEMLPSPDEGQEADVFVGDCPICEACGHPIIPGAEQHCPVNTPTASMEKEDATDRREGLRLPGTDNDANVHGVSSRHDDCGDPGCCPDNPLTPSPQGLVERLRDPTQAKLGVSLRLEAADALERMEKEYKDLDDSHTHFYVGFHNQMKTIAALRSALERMDIGWKACRESLWALRAENEALTKTNETLLADEKLAQAYIDNRALRAENERLKMKEARDVIVHWLCSDDKPTADSLLEALDAAGYVVVEKERWETATLMLAWRDAPSSSTKAQR